MEIEDAKRVQRDLGLGDVHVFHITEAGFVMAHTDAERASGMDLRTCEVHEILADAGDIWERPYGWYQLDDEYDVKGIAL